MKIPAERLKEALQQYLKDGPPSRKFTRFIEALGASLAKAEYGPDGLIFACEDVIADPANDFDRRDGHEMLKRLSGEATYRFPSSERAFTEDFQEAVSLYLRSPAR